MGTPMCRAEHHTLFTRDATSTLRLRADPTQPSVVCLVKYIEVHDIHCADVDKKLEAQGQRQGIN